MAATIKPDTDELPPVWPNPSLVGERPPFWLIQRAKAELVRALALRHAEVWRRSASGAASGATAASVEVDVRGRSVVFYTVHKCASTFVQDVFASLAPWSRLLIINYAQAIASRNDWFEVGLRQTELLDPYAAHFFRPQREFYGPLRGPVSLPPDLGARLVFFVRDPRDVLVSAWHSFAFTHVEPKGRRALRTFRRGRQMMLEMGMDAWVRHRARDWMRPLFERYDVQRRASEDPWVVRYDEFRADPEAFVLGLCELLGARPPESWVAQWVEWAQQGRSSVVMPEGHVRSGHSGQWQDELQPETVRAIDDELADVLECWGFRR